jgi:hypothetical protein
MHQPGIEEHAVAGGQLKRFGLEPATRQFIPLDRQRGRAVMLVLIGPAMLPGATSSIEVRSASAANP